MGTRLNGCTGEYYVSYVVKMKDPSTVAWKREYSFTWALGQKITELSTGNYAFITGAFLTVIRNDGNTLCYNSYYPEAYPLYNLAEMDGHIYTVGNSALNDKLSPFRVCFLLSNSRAFSLSL